MPTRRHRTAIAALVAIASLVVPTAAIAAERNIGGYLVTDAVT